MINCSWVTIIMLILSLSNHRYSLSTTNIINKNESIRQSNQMILGCCNGYIKCVGLTFEIVHTNRWCFFFIDLYIAIICVEVHKTGENKTAVYIHIYTFELLTTPAFVVFNIQFSIYFSFVFRSVK